MNLENKNVLVLGLGISGLSTIIALDKLGANIIISDAKSEEELKGVLDQVEEIPMELNLNTDDIDISGIDLVIKSPGIPPNAKLVKKSLANNIEVITDIELAYRISPTNNIIAITGTNGKTTTTTLVGEIFKKINPNTFVVGNIGVGILDKIVEANEDDIFVIEASSFQLEHCKDFKPHVSLILNISPDHLDWHGSYENYIEAKLKVLENQNSHDYSILNYDDKILFSIKDKLKSKVILFSLKECLDTGIFIENNNIIIKDEFEKTILMPCNELKILGKHNLENALGAVGIALAMGAPLDIVRDTLRNFKGVEHRIEFVVNKRGINFYNDSKGTNTDASIKAIEALDCPIILIAGGYDKGVSFDDFIKSFNNKVKALILLGATKYKIKECAQANGFENIFMVENMNEAVELSYKLGQEQDNVLLSPACASWGMYNNFEERGKDFKNAIYELME